MKLLFGADLVPTPITEKGFIEKNHKITKNLLTIEKNLI